MNVEIVFDQAKATKMGTAARERVVRKFYTEVVVEENIGFYEGIVSGNP